MTGFRMQPSGRRSGDAFPKASESFDEFHNIQEVATPPGAQPRIPEGSGTEGKVDPPLPWIRRV